VPDFDTEIFVARRPTDSKTVALLLTATEYAVASVQRTIHESSGDTVALQRMLDSYVDAVFGLEVGFLFPTLAHHERELLVSLMKARNALGVHLNGLPQWRTPTQRVEHENLATTLKADFANLCREVMASGLEERLDPVQRRVLEEEFLSILLDKEESTKLFFRKAPTAPISAAAIRNNPKSGPLHARITASSGQPQKPSRSPLPPPNRLAPSAKVLIIDRDRSEAETVATWLRDAGYDAIAGEVGFDSCRVAMRNKPDLILLEFTSASTLWSGDSVLDGQTLLKLLLQVPRVCTTPVIGVAVEDDTFATAQVLGAGAVDCLRKPLDRDRLLTAVQAATSHRPPRFTARTDSRSLELPVGMG
jgi:CheY-like chemotaxis protein